MRLTADVILRAQVSINPLRERELNLRGYKAPAIENLGITQDGFDCIDLSDNEIKKLENFPRLRRLRMLLLHNNHVVKIQANLSDAIANMEFLMLTGNRIARLSEVDHLACFTKLDTLSLSGNPVTKRKYYREYVIYTLPQLHVLDFQRIRPRDREAASAFFNSVVGQRVIREAHGEIVAAPTQSMEDVTITEQQHVAVAASVAPPPEPRASGVLKEEKAVKAPPPEPRASGVLKEEKAVKAPPPEPRASGVLKEKEAAVAPPTEPRASDVEMEEEAAVAPPTEPRASDVEMEEEAVVAPPTEPHASDVSEKEEAAKVSPKETAKSEPMDEEVPEAKHEMPPADVEMEEAAVEEITVAYTPFKPISQMTVTILREELKKLGLSIKGLKAELVKRLKEAAGEA
ncbi:unnamed protein product [Hyaloperonospora brassicae]|uniref:SAP domain-containing protein n=1 Tax=Hyaloperonospora brassicae TaxID=162125 RepID=A0AAV0V741_HYABA|nr:unnamed protein product [Hyaloperonospora brassicae]